MTFYLPELRENKSHRILYFWEDARALAYNFTLSDMSLALWRFVSLINHNSVVCLLHIFSFFSKWADISFHYNACNINFFFLWNNFSFNIHNSHSFYSLKLYCIQCFFVIPKLFKYSNMRALFIIIFQLAILFFVECIFNDNVLRLNDNKFLNVGYLNTVITSTFYTTTLT